MRIACLLLATAGLLATARATPVLAASRASITVAVEPAVANRVPSPLADTIVPLPGPPFLERVRICPQLLCSSPPPQICPSDSIVVQLAGTFPTDCYTVRRIDYWFPPVVPVSIRPIAPVVRVVVDDRGCLGRPCVTGEFPWNGWVTLPPLPEGPYQLPVAVIQVTCTDTVPPPPWPTAYFPFAVAPCDSTPPPVGCMVDGWEHPSGPGACDAFVSKTEFGRVTFTLRTSVALAGLQGGFEIRPYGLQIVKLEPVGAASGMKLAWTATDAGARFVMFGVDGDTIPHTPPDRPAPVLALTLAAGVRNALPAESRVYAMGLMGSDPAGHTVPICPMRAGTDSSGQFIEPSALVCSGTGCDYNADGRTDVRDLVLMVNCLRPGPVGAPPCTAVFDCNGDGVSTLDDVLCCAWRILRAQPCTLAEGCPPDSVPLRPDPNVRVNVGLPVESGGAVSVPIHIEGAEGLGAARLAMRFPADRYRVVGLETTAAAWLPLAGAESDEIVMGVIRLSPAAGARPLDLTLRLERLGGDGGGELGALQGQFSAPDGAMLAVQVNGPVRPLPGGTEFSLSENRPDPFTGATRFTLTLPRAAPVDLAVYDVNGRRVATLHHGPLGAGVSEFSWNGRQDAGGAARGGIYFYRADVDGRSASRKMVRLSGN